ncbi:hypothetical protein TPHA_0J00240 [Tetrapisispora phaffii CBS 4417]|uniref:Uncharacterized protein n=1 Tax=Tetrapisispora phaffii (strain ATCC 24235 / CBS 4417 / NBRC 1672 / NRRL Y-8282 / UCD 70-5) TaxID=1071381 RepID=G8BYA6_TETPH|nr:hypothetical protein TPHA_0J00240 [Tetrapisispora phaffii CBS 4417]CCE64848.1 hypothetical protein TPHA_0J00240 [Tetrapisispora phaffii CBS 4417]
MLLVPLIATLVSPILVHSTVLEPVDMQLDAVHTVDRRIASAVTAVSNAGSAWLRLAHAVTFVPTANWTLEAALDHYANTLAPIGEKDMVDAVARWSAGAGAGSDRSSDAGAWTWLTAPIDAATVSLIRLQSWHLRKLVVDSPEATSETRLQAASSALLVEQALRARRTVVHMLTSRCANSNADGGAAISPRRKPTPDEYLLYLRKFAFFMAQATIIGAFCMAAGMFSCYFMFAILLPASTAIWISVILQFRRGMALP